eukprot:scaffold120939_cov20-Tisochrysis_lutea.AAC.2
MQHSSRQSCPEQHAKMPVVARGQDRRAKGDQAARECGEGARDNKSTNAWPHAQAGGRVRQPPCGKPKKIGAIKR